MSCLAPAGRGRPGHGEWGKQSVRQPSDRWVHLALGAVSLLIATVWIFALGVTPTEQSQGDVYRIIYLHVPSAAITFGLAAVLCVVSLLALRRPTDSLADLGRAVVEMDLLFTGLTLLTGSLWGRPTWGVYWTWDARLTTTLILFLLLTGYLVLHTSIEAGRSRTQACAALGVVIFANIPIIYKSVDWWRTLHQPPTLVRSGGSTLSPEFFYTLLGAMVAYGGFAAWCVFVRWTNLRRWGALESAALDRGIRIS